MKKRIISSVLKAAALLIIAAAPYVVFCGLPLRGLPDAEDIMRVEATYFHTKETKTFDGADDIRLARKAAGYLRRLPFASLTEEDPRYTLVFVTQTGERTSVTAGYWNIEYNGRPMRGSASGEKFVETLDGLFRR